jgi:protein disulfide-isomerase A6
MVVWLLALSSAYLLEIQSMESARSILSSEEAVFILFTKNNCGECDRTFASFDRAASFFEKPHFLVANCHVVSPLCDENGITAQPFVGLLRPRTGNRTQFMGDRSPDGFADFVERETGERAKRPPRILAELTPESYPKFREDHNCTFVFYYSGICSHCRKILPEVHKAAPAFQFDGHTKMAIFNCGLYEDFCEENNAANFPIGWLYRSGEKVLFEGEKTVDRFVEFINDKCGAQRGMDGNLNDEAGRIVTDEMKRLVREFKAGGDRAKILEQVKGIEGAETYVWAMERIVANGDATVSVDCGKMSEVIQKRKGSAVSIDGVKRRLNVLREFLPEEKPPEL